MDGSTTQIMLFGPVYTGLLIGIWMFLSLINSRLKDIHEKLCEPDSAAQREAAQKVKPINQKKN